MKIVVSLAALAADQLLACLSREENTTRLVHTVLDLLENQTGLRPARPGSQS